MNNLLSTYWALRNKISNKICGTVHMPHQGKKRGDVLISYLIEPFICFPWQKLSTRHSSYWECLEMARLFAKRGFAVDIIRWNDNTFVPKKPYAVCIDTQKNLERLSVYLPKTTKKVMHLVSSHWKFQNDAEKKRLDALMERKGIRLVPRRVESPSQNIEIADFVEGLGSKASYATYAFANKQITPIPITSPCTYEFDGQKDFEKSSRHYLWIGGGGAVLKGLDLVLEAFSKMPEYSLEVCGPVSAEKDFFEAYKRELLETPNITYRGRIDVDGDEFKKILHTSIGVLHASASEGGGGAAIQAMHGGLIPIATKESTVPLGNFGIEITEPTPQEIERAVRTLSSYSAEELFHRSKEAWIYARTHHTNETFSKAYGTFIDTVLKP